MDLLKKSINIGLIQPVINPEKCWNTPIKKRYSLNIDKISAERVWQEIKDGLNILLKEKNRPDIILIPELHLPIDKIGLISDISKKYNTLIISGVDFQQNNIHLNKIKNEAIIFVPNNWGNELKSSKVNHFHLGKTFYTYMERDMFPKLDIGKCVEDIEQKMYVFKSNIFGNFGVMICSDIFDIERMLLYQGRIQHLFVISLNKDLNTYFSFAETLTRLLYCNVVICNTGFYGGSVAVSPKEDVNERLIYKYQGQNMVNTNLITLPLKDLFVAQNFEFHKKDKKKYKIKFKASPPGYNFIP